MQEAESRPTPEALLTRFRAEGRSADLAALFDATAPDLFRLALHLVPDAATAEDVLQETFLAVLEGAAAYEPGRPALPWLHGVLRNQAGSARRRQARRPEPARLAALPTAEDPAERAANDEEKERLHAAMLGLPEPYRGVALLRWRYGLEPAAIAEVRGEPPGTVRSLLHRALRRLRVEMGALPALFLAFRPERGLEGVRSSLLRRAAARIAVPVGAPAAGLVAAGGIVMAQKVGIASAVAVALGVVAWVALRDVPPPVPGPAPRPSVARSDTKTSGTAETPAPPVPPLDSAALADLPQPVDLDRCDRDLDLHGVVVDDDGRPVPGATIECVRFPWRRSDMADRAHYREELVGPTTRSAVDGTFAIRLPRGRMADLRGTAPGFGQGDLTQCQAGERVQLVLRRRGGCVSLRAVDEGGRPVPGVRLRFWGVDPPYNRDRYHREGITGADGRFEFSRLAPGKARLAAEHDEFGIPEWLLMDVPAQGTLDQVLTMPSGRAVTGRVTDAGTGEPIPGARVGSNWVMDRPVAVDPSGRYRFPGWTGKGTSVLRAAAPGYACVMRVVPEAGDLDFALESAFRVEGRVVDASGAPVEGARVTAQGWWKGEGDSGSDRAFSVTGPDGRFSLADLSRRTDHEVVAEADGHGRVRATLPPAAAGVDDVDMGDFALVSARAIEGRALDAEGRPLSFRSVYVVALRRADDPAIRETGSDGFAGMGESRRTDDLGRFRFPGLSPGRHRLYLREAGAPEIQAEVDLPADRDVLDALLRRQGRSITILVTDLAGKPLSGIMVLTNDLPPQAPGSASNVTLTTGADGRATFRSLPEGRLAGRTGLRFSVQPLSGEGAPPFAWHTTESLVPAGQEVKVALKPAAMVRGRVLGPDGEAIAGLYVNAFDASGVAAGAGACSADGGFAIRVPAGEPLTIRIPGHRHMDKDPKAPIAQTPYRGEVEGITAPVSDLVLRARRVGNEGSLRVLVLDLDGKPVPEYEVGLMRVNEPQQQRKTDGAGRAEFDGLLEDSWYLAPRMPVPTGVSADTVVPATVEVVPSGQQVELRFRRGVPLEGVVLHEDGTPAANATVYAQFRWGSPMTRTKSGVDGRFRLLFGEGDEAFVLSAWWWDEEAKKGFSAQSTNVRADGTELALKLEPAKPR